MIAYLVTVGHCWGPLLARAVEVNLNHNKFQNNLPLDLDSKRST